MDGSSPPPSPAHQGRHRDEAYLRRGRCVQAVAGLSGWVIGISSDDKTCPCKLGQSPGSLADYSLCAADKGTKRGHLRVTNMDGAHCSLKLGHQERCWGSPSQPSACQGVLGSH